MKHTVLINGCNVSKIWLTRHGIGYPKETPEERQATPPKLSKKLEAVKVRLDVLIASGAVYKAADGTFKPAEHVPAPLPFPTHRSP